MTLNAVETELRRFTTAMSWRFVSSPVATRIDQGSGGLVLRSPVAHARMLVAMGSRVCLGGLLAWPDVTTDGSSRVVGERAHQERPRLEAPSILFTTPSSRDKIDDVGPDPPQGAV